MLYKNGMPLYLILLVYGLRFAITGLCTPLFISISHRIGIASCVFISNVFSIVGSYMILHSNNGMMSMILFIVVIGMMGLSNPINDALSSKYVETRHRGRYNSLLNVLTILGQACASLAVAWGVITNSDMILFVIVTLGYILQYFFILPIDYKPERKNNAFAATIKYITKNNGKYKWIYALRTSHIIERQFLPLYLFLVLKDFTLFSSVIFLSLTLQVITVLLVGKLTDKNIIKTNNVVTLIKILITTVFLFIKNKILISLNKMLNDNFEKVYETSIQTSIQNIIRESKDNNELLSAVGQMSLCFTEVIVFSILSLLSMFIGEYVFYIIFLASIFSTFMINRLVKEKDNQIS